MSLKRARKKSLRSLVPAERVRLDRHGYDRHGRYFGQGAPLYFVGIESPAFLNVFGSRGGYVRARSAAEAREKAMAASASFRERALAGEFE